MEYKIHFAPLQGYTDSVYREAHAQVFGGVDTYYTPFVRLEKGDFRNKEMRDISVSEEMKKITIPQLIAATPDEIRTIVTLFRDKGYSKADINLGCPFPMQARLHRGAGILPYKDEVEALMHVIEEFSDFSFSAKLRLGWDNAKEALELLPLLEGLPLHHITLHPRLGVWQYKGNVDMEAFDAFYQACKHPLYFNGDIQLAADVQSLTARFPNLQGVMMGRGLLAHPWIAIEHERGKEFGASERREKLTEFHALLMERYQVRLEGGEHQVVDKLKTLWDYLLPEAEKRLRKKVLKSNNMAAYKLAVSDLIKAYPFV